MPATETEFSSLSGWSDGAREFKLPVKTSVRQEKQNGLEKLRSQNRREIKDSKKLLQIMEKAMEKIAAFLVLGRSWEAFWNGEAEGIKALLYATRRSSYSMRPMKLKRIGKRYWLDQHLPKHARTVAEGI